jgi:hypothetical protein
MAASSAAAQTAPAAAAEAAPAASFTDAQLRGYAGAWIELARIQEELNPRIQAATGDARTALERQAAERMGASVTQHGLDPETFNRISTAMRADDALAQQINGFVQEVSAAAQTQGAAQEGAGN